MKDKTTRFTILLHMDDLKDVLTEPETEGVRILYTKESIYEQNKYAIMEIEIDISNKYDDDPEVIMGTYNGLAIHQEWSRCFFIIDDDIEELEQLYSWSGAGRALMAELLTPEEKIDLLKYKQKISNQPGLIYGKNPNKILNDGWINVEEEKEDIFIDKYIKYRFGNIGDGFQIWWPTIVEESKLFNFVIQKEEDNVREKITNHIPSPWDDEDDNYYHYYDY